MSLRWGAYGFLAFWSSWKFLWAPTSGWIAGLNYWEIVIVHSITGWLSFILFYYFASFFVARGNRRREEKIRKALEQGKVYNPRKFTRLNKLIIRIKQWKQAYVTMLFLAASIASIQVGAVVLAKFYPNRKQMVWHSALMFGFNSLWLVYVMKFAKAFGWTV